VEKLKREEIGRGSQEERGRGGLGKEVERRGESENEGSYKGEGKELSERKYSRNKKNGV
jgi:hypothetical protein